MPVHRSLLPALTAAAAILGATLLPLPASAATPTAPASAETDDPLAVSIDSLNPSVIPESGIVTITGTVTNQSTETWTGVNVYPLSSESVPMTTPAELDAAAQTDVDLVIGARILEVSDSIDELAPGQVARYALRVPRRYLGTAEGVHWLGVHALAQNAAGRDEIADGKARTFLPLIGENRRPIRTALVLQLRRRIVYAVDGRLDRPDRWATDLAPGGRLRSLVELGAAAGDRPLTWLMDPAVVASVNALVAGNDSRLPPPAPVREEEEENDESASPTASPTASQTSSPPASPTEPSTEAPETSEGSAGGVLPGATGGLTDPADPIAIAAAAAQGQAWLERLRPALDGKQLLTLPYGDVDASAASHLRPETLAAAQTTAAEAMTSLGLTATPALGSPSGFLNPRAIRDAAPDTTVLASSAAVPGEAPAVVSVQGHPVVLSSATAVGGGPGPDDPLATVAVRQRILGEAAVRLLGQRRAPLIVTLPGDWIPSDANGFFTGLDVDWVDLSTVSEVLDDVDTRVTTLAEEDYRYPAFQEEFELDAVNFDAAADLIQAGGTLQQVLTRTQTVDDAVRAEAFTEASYWQRPSADTARSTAARSRSWIDQTLSRITIDGPPSVTLSSSTGLFPATVTNGLDEPVVVRVGATTSQDLRIEVPDEGIPLDPGESARLRLSASTDAVGAHTVRLFVVADDGTPLGAATQLPVRSNQVSRIIWIVMIVGAGLLFGAIAVRLVRRFRTG